jgi:diphosphomevalonate decarboxylase
MKVTAKAPSNIAFIKYWGKRDEKLRIPENSSISMNLSRAFTITSVEFSNKFKSDSLFINGLKASVDETKRVSIHLDLIRSLSKINDFARVESRNNFPKASGIASSASGFAALTLAGAKAAGLSLSEKELTILARLGSGSACRSIPDGFVEWKMGRTGNDSYAHSLFAPQFWNICDLIAVVGKSSKKVSSSEGHAIAESSPFYKTRIVAMENKLKKIKLAMKNKDFTKFGEILEAEAINMHMVMMTSNPPLYYWLPETLKVMVKVMEWRNKGLESYFTIDAGPNVHVICRTKDVDRLTKRLRKLSGVRSVLVNTPALGARIIEVV